MLPDAIKLRPLFYASLFLSAGIFFQSYFSRSLFWLTLLFVLGLVLIIVLRTKKFFRFFVLGLAMVLVGAFVHARAQFVPREDLTHFVKSSDVVYLGGVVISDVSSAKTFYGDTRTSFTLQAKKLWLARQGEGAIVRGKTRVTVKNPGADFHYGDEIVLGGSLSEPKSRRNPEGFDYRKYLESRGIRTLFHSDGKIVKILRPNKANPVEHAALSIKAKLSRGLSAAFSAEEAAFLQALFLGERSDMEEDFKDLFLKTGTIHILAVSGFNIGFLWFCVMLLLKPFPISVNLKRAISLGAIWFYCLLVGWQAPVVRAGLMASILILGRLLGRKTDLLNSLGLAALVILCLRPSNLFDVGFQLSFLTVGGIAFFVPRFIETKKLLPNETFTLAEKARFYFEELFWVSFVCLCVTLPVTVQRFFIVSPVALLANLVVVPLAFLIYSFEFIFLLTFFWLPSWLSFVPYLLSGLIRCLVAALYFIESIPGSSMVVGKMNAFLWVLLVTGTVYAFIDLRLKNRFARAAVIALFISSVLLGQSALRFLPRELRMTTLDVGQGEAIVMEMPKGGTLLLDAGPGGDSDAGRRVVGPFLKSRGVAELDLFVVSHPQADHIGGAAFIFKEFKVHHALIAGQPYPSELFQEFQQALHREGTHVLKAIGDTTLTGFKEIAAEVLHPSLGTQEKNINNASVVMRVLYGDTSFLLTGDIEEGAMKAILDSGQTLASTVLKVPHHGARLKIEGNRFIQAVHPTVSIISAGERNIYGHPSPETLNILSAIPGNSIYRTDRDGAVSIFSDGKRVIVRRS